MLWVLAVCGCGWVVWVVVVYGLRARLNDGSLCEDLNLLARNYRLDTIVGVDKRSYTQASVVRYYTRTTDRDYWLLEMAVGPGMHTKLANGLSQLQLILTEIALVDAKSVLDIGCGRGYGTAYLASCLPTVCFFGVDMVSRHIQAARQLRCQNAAFVQDEAIRFLAVAPARFDVVYGLESLCHMDSMAKMRAFMIRCRGVLEPGGRLVIVDRFRSAAFERASADQQLALGLAECGFRIRNMPSKSDWIMEAALYGFKLERNLDLTADAMPFWTRGWKITRVLLRLGVARVLPAESAANLMAVATIAHAMRDRAAAEYGMLVFSASE